MRKLTLTQSICPKCKRIIPASVFERGGRVFLRSTCPEHGEIESDHVWDDPEIYRGLKKVDLISGKAMQVVVDTTRDCNLNCPICFARANEYKGNKFKIENLDSLKDYRQVFLSGGEPTMREDLPKIIRRCVRNGQKPILFTNGIKLADINYLQKLKRAGLRSVLLQFDTLSEEDSQYIRGQNLVKLKIKALRNLNKLNIPTSIWTVVIKNSNFKDLERLSRFFLKFPNVKTISTIPIWRIGRYREEDFVPSSKIIEKLGQIYGISKGEFVATTELVCNLDRVLGILDKKRGKLFGVCMLKGLFFEKQGQFIPIGRIFNLDEINKKVNEVIRREEKYTRLIVLLWYFITRQVVANFATNKHFRKVFFQFLRNLRYIFSGKFLLLNPFRYITIGIFPSAKNIDLDFIEACNSYAFSADDYSLRPACLHYIETEKRS